MGSELMATRVTSIVDEDINTTQSIQKRLRHLLYLPYIRHIAGNCQALATHTFNPGNELFEFVGGASCYRYICACFCQCKRDAATNTTSRARHDCSFTAERELFIVCHFRRYPLCLGDGGSCR